MLHIFEVMIKSLRLCCIAQSKIIIKPLKFIKTVQKTNKYPTQQINAPKINHINFWYIHKCQYNYK